MIAAILAALARLFTSAKTTEPDAPVIKAPASPGSTRFQACLVELAEAEGGYVNHLSDPGGPTNMGITQATLASWRGKPVTADDVKNLTRAEAEAIYRKNYWHPIKGDALPDGVDLAVFDLAVNSGPAKAAMMLQSVVGVAQDGVIGPLTLAAVGKMSAATIITRLCADRMAFLRSLTTWPVFGRGWTARVEKVQAAALKAAGPSAAG